ncbi:hypothetical protein TB1_008612 [Malus domestica]
MLGQMNRSIEGYNEGLKIHIEALGDTDPRDQLRQLKRFNVDEDCPVFDGLYSFCQTYASGSVSGAVKLNNGIYDISINWAGGLHHTENGDPISCNMAHVSGDPISCDMAHVSGLVDAQIPSPANTTSTSGKQEKDKLSQ